MNHGRGKGGGRSRGGKASEARRASPARPVLHLLERSRKAALAGDVMTAEILCAEALEHSPRDFSALELRARLLAERGLYAKAVRELRPLLARGRNQPELRQLLGDWLRRSDAHREAVAVYDSLLELNPHDLMVKEGLATSLVMLSERARARTLLEDAFRAGKTTPAMSVTLVRVLVDSGENEPAIQAIGDHLQRADLRDGHRRRLYALQGKALERLGRFDEAFAAYATAARFDRLRFDRRAYREEIDALIRFFTPEWFETCPRSTVQDDQMVFIVGMPRSGSTLTERIIDAHPQARAVGEHPAMFELQDRIRNDLNYIEPWPLRLGRLTPDVLTQLAMDYLGQVREGLAGERCAPLRLVDKALWNTHTLGLIAMLLPNSRIIWARRNPEDSCFSCFSEAFNPRLAAYASDLEDLGFVHREIDRLMRHWQEVLPIPLKLVQYEEIVADQERASRDVIDFVGLPWHEDCLQFYRKATPSATASYEQVRRPVYDSSIGRAARFERHIAPLRAALGEADRPPGR